MAYEEIAAAELTLRDRLALDRTRLANERTLLAYVRTAMMLMVAGGTAIKFFGDEPRMVLSGWTLVLLGLVVGVCGGCRFAAVRKAIRDARERAPRESD